MLCKYQRIFVWSLKNLADAYLCDDQETSLPITSTACTGAVQKIEPKIVLKIIGMGQLKKLQVCPTALPWINN